MRRLAAAVGLAVLTAIGATVALVAEPLAAEPLAVSAAQRDVLQKAMAAVRSGQWTAAQRLADQAGLPVGRAFLDWFAFSQGFSSDFHAISGFVDAHTGWPRQNALRRALEAGSLASVGHAQVIDWFERYPPLTADGRIRLAEAYIAVGERARGEALARRIWVDDDMPLRIEREFLQRFGRYVAPADHSARLDRLLWDRRQDSALRMLPRVNDDDRRLANARLSLMTFAAGVDSAIARVPGHLAAHPGLAYDRVRWRRAKGNVDGVREILFNPPDELVRPEKWWPERALQARILLRRGYISEAYRMVKAHGQTAAETASEAEWLAGWIAHSFLNDYRVAYSHFTHGFRVVRYPISLARMSYWAGVSAEAMGAPAAAELWFQEAARHPMTFYGQLALGRRDRSPVLHLPPEPAPSSEEAARFEQRELVQVVRLLGAIDETNLIRPFMLRLVEELQSPGEFALLGGLARSVGRPDLGVVAAKRAHQNGIFLAGAGYPVAGFLRQARVEPALLHAVARQESEFNSAAISPAGAQGLMQLMPATAKLVAHAHQIAYRQERLLDDPAYNATIASAHLGDLIASYRGSLILALAAYNAGPGNVREWLRDWGDPREREIDPVDWIELIPFPETRDYVQRVLEGLQVYRNLIAGDAVPLSLRRDLRSGS